MSTSTTSASAVLLLVKAEHAAATERLRLLEALVGADAKVALKGAAKKEKKAAAAAAAEAGEPVAKKPRGVWVAWVYGEPSPSDDGEPIPSAAARFPTEHAAFVATLASKRGADINFASEASTAAEGDPVGISKPVAEEGESDEDYAERVEAWRATDGATWSVDAHEVYAEHVARYKAIVEARSADGSSSKSRRVKLTEEQVLANREARKAATKAKNDALKEAARKEKEAAKAVKPAPKAKAAPPVVKNAAKPPAKAPAKGKAVVVSLTAADDDSDSDSEEEEEEERFVPPPPPKGKAPPPPPKAVVAVAAAAVAKAKPGPPAPKPKGKAAAAAPPPPASLSLVEEEEAPAEAAAPAPMAEETGAV